METRYHSLRIVSGIYKGLAVLSMIGTVGFIVISAIGVLSSINNYAQVYGSPYPTYLWVSVAITGALVFLGGSLAALSLYAAGSFIDVFLATEENTRLTAALLNRVSKQLQRGSIPRQSAASAARAAATPVDEFDLGAL